MHIKYVIIQYNNSWRTRKPFLKRTYFQQSLMDNGKEALIVKEKISRFGQVNVFEIKF